MAELKPVFSKPLLVLIALLQGLALLVLHESRVLEFWPNGDMAWLVGLYTLAALAPTLLLLALSDQNCKQVAGLVALFALIVGLAGFYNGSQMLTLASPRHQVLLLSLTLSLLVAAFIALFLIQRQSLPADARHINLTLLSWRNALTLLLAALFMLAIWALLMLWGGLFRLIQIHFFYDLFTARWFYYPVLSMAAGFGVVLFREHAAIIDTLAGLQQTMMKFLLVLLVVIALLFLSSLPFTGLQALWETGRGSMLILWMQALMLFFVNAVYRQEQTAPVYPPGIHRLIALGLLCLPVYSIIACYGLLLRIDQYGWTVARCAGVMIWALLALLAVLYSLALLRYRDGYLRALPGINLAMAWVLLISMLAINSPLVDFRKISADSQLARLQSGAVPLDKADFYYFRRSLEKPGYEALMQFKQSLTADQAGIALRIDTVYRDHAESVKAIVDQQFFYTLKHRPVSELPEALEQAVLDWLSANARRAAQFSGASLYQLDVDGDGGMEYLLAAGGEQDWRETAVFYLTEDGWQIQNYRFGYRDESFSDEENTAEVIAPRWPLIRIGQRVLQTDNNLPHAKSGDTERD